MLNASDVPQEELLAAALRRAATCWPDHRTFLIEAGRTLATQLREDHPRLLAILERMRP